MKNPPSNNNNHQWASSFFETEEAADTLPRFTDHTYHDFSTYIEDGGTIEKHKKCEQNFPARLHAMLSNEKYSHIISWMPHGRAWKVLDKKLLVEEAIPNYFGQSKYASFTRQLNGWGFKRLYQTGPDFGCYYHQCFLRGHPQLTILMRRISPGQGNTAKNVHEEPDFYAIEEQFPLHVTGEESVYSPTFECKRKEEEEAERKVKESNASHEAGAFDSFLPASSSLNSSVSLAAIASTSRCDCETSVNQFNVKKGDQYMGKTQDETGHMNTVMFSHNYLGATGNFYQNVPAEGFTKGSSQGGLPTQPMAAAPICDGLSTTDGTLCHGSSSNQHSVGVGHELQHPYPAHLQTLSHDPLMFYGSSLGYNSMNFYSQHQSNNGQPTRHAGASAAANSRPNSFFQNPLFVTAVPEDPLMQMPMSIPEQGFDFHTSSLEDLFRESSADPTTTFLG